MSYIIDYKMSYFHQACLVICRTNCSDGEDELLNSLVEQESPESKLQTSVILGGAVTLGAVVVSSLLGKDPWGGVSPTLETLSAAATGLAAALPLAALRVWSWTPSAARAIPALQVRLRALVAHGVSLSAR